MAIDIIFLVLLAMAAFKGFRRGFIVAIFSFLAIVIGLAAAIKSMQVESCGEIHQPAQFCLSLSDLSAALGDFLSRTRSVC